MRCGNRDDRGSRFAPRRKAADFWERRNALQVKQDKADAVNLKLEQVYNEWYTRTISGTVPRHDMAAHKLGSLSRQGQVNAASNCSIC